MALGVGREDVVFIDGVDALLLDPLLLDELVLGVELEVEVEELFVADGELVDVDAGEAALAVETVTWS